MYFWRMQGVDFICWLPGAGLRAFPPGCRASPFGLWNQVHLSVTVSTGGSALTRHSFLLLTGLLSFLITLSMQTFEIFM